MKLNQKLINQIQNDIVNALGVNPSYNGAEVWFDSGHNGPMSWCSSFDIYFDKVKNFDYDTDYIEKLLISVTKKYDLTPYWEGGKCRMHVPAYMDPYVEPDFDYDNDPYLNSPNNGPKSVCTGINTDKNPVTTPVMTDIPASLEIEGPVNFAERSPMRTNYVHNSSLNPFAKAAIFGSTAGVVAFAGMFVYEKIKEDEDHPVNYKKVIVGALLTAGVAGCISYHIFK